MTAGHRRLYVWNGANGISQMEAVGSDRILPGGWPDCCRATLEIVGRRACVDRSWSSVLMLVNDKPDSQAVCQT